MHGRVSSSSIGNHIRVYPPFPFLFLICNRHGPCHCLLLILCFVLSDNNIAAVSAPIITLRTTNAQKKHGRIFIEGICQRGLTVPSSPPVSVLNSKNRYENRKFPVPSVSTKESGFQRYFIKKKTASNGKGFFVIWEFTLNKKLLLDWISIYLWCGERCTS